MRRLAEDVFSVFIDGLGDRISKAKVCAIFSKARKLLDVFVQFRRKEGRLFKFAFVRYDSDQAAWREIQLFNGLKLDRAYLDVKKARFQRNQRSTQL